MTNQTAIKEAADAYWQGIASVDQHRLLQEAVSSGTLHGVDPALHIYISGLMDMKLAILDDDFDDEVIARIQPAQPTIVKRMSMSRILRYAAAVLLLATAAIGYWQIGQPSSDSADILVLDDLETRRQFDEMKSALAMVSHHLRTGATETRRLAVLHETKVRIQSMQQD